MLAGALLRELATKDSRDYDLLITELGIVGLSDSVDEVHALCWLLGFDALIRSLKVSTYGLAFYAD